MIDTLLPILVVAFGAALCGGCWGVATGIGVAIAANILADVLRPMCPCVPTMPEATSITYH